ncbi:hypothetical protein LZ575_16660 [Antarcticibacterium sp. 1MA-6-2]|uniref:hypothetical protein n=1 Tax=Antarcticibacterium sp. 1MA-6-2 TaxID=2908210 RepID=UPI001F3185BF|nr:hypothetical protein [Antarcticibacterium sp. 1MA-6-2]UJH90443.1 hypothetical protein LZ575_16660 [Antarcticibacterium sp. 1MA-6-2]
MTKETMLSGILHFVLIYKRRNVVILKKPLRAGSEESLALDEHSSIPEHFCGRTFLVMA